MKKVEEVFFIRGFSVYGVTRLEDLVNFHPRLNCRGDFDFEGLGYFFADFLKRKKSIVIYERNPNLFKHNIYNAVKEMMFTLCGSRFDYVGASSNDCIHPFFIRESKYLIVYQNLNDSLISFFKKNLDLGLNDIEMVDALLLQSQDFISMLELHKSANLGYNDILGFLQSHKKLNDFWVNQWYTRYSKDYISATERNAKTHWVKYSSLFKDYINEIEAVYKFLGVDVTSDIVYHECVSSGFYDYPHNNLTDSNLSLNYNMIEKVRDLDHRINILINKHKNSGQ